MNNEDEYNFEEDDFEEQEYEEPDFEEQEYEEPNFENEDSEDEESDDELDGLFEDDKEYEEFAVPFFSVHAKKLPSKYNPNEISKKSSVLLYNPFDKVDPFKKMNPKGINLDVLSNYLILDKKPLSLSDDFSKISNYKKMIVGGKSFIESIKLVIDKSNKLKIENEFNNNYENKEKNTFKNKKSNKNKYTPNG